MVNQQLPKLLAAWPQAIVPLQYYYEYKGQYWVDPTTGILVDTTKQEVRKVGLGDAFVKTTPLALLPAAQQALLRVTVSDYTYTQSDASVKDAAKQAKDLTNKLNLFGTTLPLALIVVGAVGIVAGAVLLLRAASRRRRRPARGGGTTPRAAGSRGRVAGVRRRARDVGMIGRPAAPGRRASRSAFGHPAPATLPATRLTATLRQQRPRPGALTTTPQAIMRSALRRSPKGRCLVA